MGRTLPRDSASYNQQVAERGEGVTYINNTTGNGDDYYASPNERVIIVDNDSTYTQNIFLPAVGESIGQTLTIASHTAAVATTGYITVTLADPIQTTLDATSTVSFVYKNGSNVIVMPTTPTGLAVGVTVYPIPASVANTYDGTSGALTAYGTPQYGFVVSHGPVGCLIDNSVTSVGYPLGQKCATAGRLGIATLTTSPQIAISMQTLTSAQLGAVYMLL